MEKTASDLEFAMRHGPGTRVFHNGGADAGFGIGATTAIFSIVEAVLPRPLPFPDSETPDGARGQVGRRECGRP